MPLDTNRFETSPQSAWPWRTAMVVEDAKLSSEISTALSEVRAACVFHVPASAPVKEVFELTGRDRPDLLFVELGATPVQPQEWMAAIQGGDGLPIVAAVHASADPEQMIGALRAGASEFLSLPVTPGIFAALERIAARLAEKRPAQTARGRIIGIVSAKGGCGATTLACHLGLALAKADPATKLLVADLDYQSPAVHRVCQVEPRRRAGETFESVRNLNSANWEEYFLRLTPEIDVMAGPDPGKNVFPEPWRIDSLFQNLKRAYPLALVDLGRHLNPMTWSFLQHVDELIVVAAPDVLALYQTRYILQTLTSRGFERARIRLILNMSDKAPRDFWIESIEQMFEMRLFGVVPADAGGLGSVPKDRLEFPADTPFGRAVSKIAGRVIKGETAGPSRRAA